MRRKRVHAVAAGVLVAVAATLAVPGTSGADPPVARDPSVIIRWNEIAERTLTENTVPVPASSLYLGFASLAMYDAVVTIEGRYEPWATNPERKPTPRPRSPRPPPPTTCCATTSRPRRMRSPPTTPRRGHMHNGSARCTAAGSGRRPRQG